MHHPIADIRQLLHQIEQLADDIAKETGVEHLAGPQGFVIQYLARYDKKEIFIKDIEKRLNISKSVSSNLIRRMEKNGFIAVVPSIKDKRYKKVVLTDFGREKVPLLKNFHRKLHGYLMQDISRDDMEVVRKVHQQLACNIRTYKGEKDAKIIETP